MSRWLISSLQKTSTSNYNGLSSLPHFPDAWGGGSAASSLSISNIAVFEVVFFFFFFFFNVAGCGEEGDSFSESLRLQPPLPFFGEGLVGLADGVHMSNWAGGIYSSLTMIIQWISWLTVWYECTLIMSFQHWVGQDTYAHDHLENSFCHPLQSLPPMSFHLQCNQAHHGPQPSCWWDEGSVGDEERLFPIWKKELMTQTNTCNLIILGNDCNAKLIGRCMEMREDACAMMLYSWCGHNSCTVMLYQAVWTNGS